MTETHRRGEIRLRSNVVMAGDEQARIQAYDLVPGEIVEQHKPHHLQGRGVPYRQRKEGGYYASCLCGRSWYEVGLHGCGLDPPCVHNPTEAERSAARARHEDALALITAEREHIEAESIETERDELPDLLGADEAVARFLGLRAITSAAPATGPPPAPERLAADPSSARAMAKRSLVEAAAHLGGFPGPYCAHPLDNLVGSLTLAQARAALAQIERGDGGELVGQADAPPKFRAAYSSAALAVNVFAPWIGREDSLRLAGVNGFDSLAFEVRFPTGLKGNPPNLDVCAEAGRRVVAVESKCTEHLLLHRADFPASYDAVVDELADATWRELYQRLRADGGCLASIDAGQLVRHYLGLRRAVELGTFDQATLLYLYWEPANADDIAACLAHRQAAEEMIGAVSDPTVVLTAMSHRTLWSDWAAPDGPEWLIEHVRALRARYDVDIGADA
jgi:hypothetical protein